MARNTQKYQKQLLKHLPEGYGFRSASDHSHYLLVDPEGRVVRAPDGRPVKCPNTPSDHRALKNDLRNVRQAGVPLR